VNRVGVDFMHWMARRRRDVDAQFLAKFAHQCRSGKFPGFYVASGEVPHAGIVATVG
jgi:hypothetical protein